MEVYKKDLFMEEFSNPPPFIESPLFIRFWEKSDLLNYEDPLVLSTRVYGDLILQNKLIDNEENILQQYLEYQTLKNLIKRHTFVIDMYKNTTE